MLLCLVDVLTILLTNLFFEIVSSNWPSHPHLFVLISDLPPPPLHLIRPSRLLMILNFSDFPSVIKTPPCIKHPQRTKAKGSGKSSNFYDFFFSCWSCQNVNTQLAVSFHKVHRLLDIHKYSFFFFFFIQVLHILTKDLQSPGTTSFSVPGNQPAKISPKVN